MLYIWYPKHRTDLNTIHEENDIIGQEELARVKAQLKWGKHTCLIMRMEHQLLSRDYRTPIKRLQDSYQEITRLLSKDHKTPMDFP